MPGTGGGWHHHLVVPRTQSPTAPPASSFSIAASRRAPAKAQGRTGHHGVGGYPITFATVQRTCGRGLCAPHFLSEGSKILVQRGTGICHQVVVGTRVRPPNSLPMEGLSPPPRPWQQRRPHYFRPTPLTFATYHCPCRQRRTLTPPESPAPPCCPTDGTLPHRWVQAGPVLSHMEFEAPFSPVINTYR